MQENLRFLSKKSPILIRKISDSYQNFQSLATTLSRLSIGHPEGKSEANAKKMYVFLLICYFCCTFADKLSIGTIFVHAHLNK